MVRGEDGGRGWGVVGGEGGSGEGRGWGVVRERGLRW